VLRDLGPADADAFVRAFLDDPPLTAALGHDDRPRPAEVRAMLRLEPRNREAGERIHFALADPASDAWIGSLMLHSFNWRHRRAEIGFFVVRAARRRGVALEAVRLAVAWAFGRLGLHRMQITTLTGNEATQRLAERAGFAREGVLRDFTFERGAFHDNVVLARVAA